MNSHLKTLVIWLVVIAVLVVGYQLFSSTSGSSRDLGQSEFYAAVESGDIEEVRVTGDAFGSRRCDCGEQLQAAMRRIHLSDLMLIDVTL